MAAGSDIYLQRQNELAVGVSSVNPDHMIAFWNDWRTIDQALDTGAGTSQGLLARLFRMPKTQPAVRSRDIAAAEGWTGVGISNNGGWNWSSGLVPGFPGDTSPEGAALRAHNFEAMADPWVSCDPVNCHVVTIAFTRGGASSLVYFRYTDQNKSETGHNWKLTIAPTILRKANNALPGKFNDKPTIIAGPNGQLLIGVVEFDGQDKGGKFQSKVLVSRSADNGQTWSTFEKISQTSGRNQSPFFVLDPNNPLKVWAFWRVFGDNSIVSQRSLDGGVTWLFNKPTTILSNYQAFDQVGQQMPAQPQFRTNAYATGGIDGSGVLHLALSERVNALSGVPSAGGTPRIVVTSSYDGGSTWTPRKPVAMSASGPQFMPAMTIVGAPRRPGDPAGKTRAEIFLVYYGADPADIEAHSPGPIAGGNVRFHTYLSHADTWNVDAQTKQVNYDPAKLVSRYQKDAFNPANVVTGAGFGVTSENRGYAIFYGGSGGFTGDYNIVTPRVPYVKTNTGGWRPTTAIDEDPSTIEVPAPSVQVAWADTRDVILPTSPAPFDATNLDTYAWSNYSPPGTGEPSACNAGSRNQNPYMAEVTMGVLAAAPLTYKDPNLPRSYPLYVQNKTNLQQVWRAKIDSAVMASFNYPFPNAPLRQEAEFVLKPYSTVTGTVFVNQSYSAPFKVTFQRLDQQGGTPLAGPATFTVVTLNTTGGTDPAAATEEVHDPILDPDVLVFTHPPDSTGKLPFDPYVQDDPTQNPLGQNPLGQNPLGQNPFGQNPLGQNAAPKEITDYTYRVKNGGTTHSAYKAIVELQQQLDPTLYNFRIIVNRATRAPGISRRDCKTLGNQFQPVQISNMQTPLGQNPLGQNPLGQNPFGQNPLGQNPLGQNPFGQNPLGQNSIVSDNSTFYVAPSKKNNSSAALNNAQQQLARGAARPAGGGRFVRVSSRAEYLNILNAPVNFGLGERDEDEVWYTLRVERMRALTASDVVFSPDAISLAVVAQAPNVVLQNGLLVVTDPPVRFKAPDLTYISALTGIPSSTSPGWAITLPNMTAKNAGNAPAVPFRQGLYLKSLQIPEGVLLGQGNATPGTLAAGASQTVPGAVLTIPRDLPPGSYEACAVLDPTNVVRESLENNNFTCVPLVLNQPDLQVAVARLPANPTTVDPVTFVVTVTNAGPGSALASTLSFPLPGDDGSGTYAIPALAANASHQVTLTRTFSAGTRTATAIADFGDGVAESNENNNQAAHSFTVVPPYLRFTVQPSNNSAGELFSPSVTVAIQNAYDQTLTGYTGDITIDVLSNPAPRLLLGTVTRPAINGVATFNDVYFTRFGTYNLVASSPGRTTGTSNAFSITDLSMLNTDVVSAGVGGMRGNGTGSITLGGLPSGSTVKKAVLYWHGPTNSTNPAANATVTFNGTSVTGTNIGFAYDNGWFSNNVPFANSQAYRANVTSLVAGNGSYALANFRKTQVVNDVTTVVADINGVSLIVFYDDHDATNNKDVYFRHINDSNIASIYDPADWDQTLGGVSYSGGTAQLVLHVSDGQQTFGDAAVELNGDIILNAGQIFAGNSVPPFANNGLWDIKSIDITGYVVNGQNNLTVTTGLVNDYLSLVVMMIVVDKPAPPAPPPAAAVIGAQRAPELRGELRRR